MTAAKIKHLFWHIVAVMTAVPFVHDYACRRELAAMREVFDRWIAENEKKEREK